MGYCNIMVPLCIIDAHKSWLWLLLLCKCCKGTVFIEILQTKLQSYIHKCHKWYMIRKYYSGGDAPGKIKSLT